MRSVIDITDLGKEELEELMKKALDIIANPEKYSNACNGKKLATLFFEPSTRTRLSFEAAMYELGGNVLSVTGAAQSSAAKGESVADTAKVVSYYADIIAMRHFKEGAAYVAAENAAVPVINAGDGGHCHPTQTLADILTIYREKGGFDGLTVGLCGDLKYGRTVHSLINFLSRYTGVKLVLISPKELVLPKYVIENTIKKCGMEYEETSSLDDSIPSLDVLYMTRIQRERFDDPDEYERLKGVYVLTPEKMQKAKSDMIVLHPLPRVDEISVRVDEDRRACYFRQAENGKYMRMALILKLLEEKNAPDPRKADKKEIVYGKYVCRNPKCITSVEQELVSAFEIKGGKPRCVYCESSSENQI